MSGTVHPHEQGRWHGQRGRGTRGPTRTAWHPTMPLPDELPAVEEMEESMDDDGQNPASGGSGGIGGPKAPPTGPSTPPPPNLPSE